MSGPSAPTLFLFFFFSFACPSATRVCPPAYDPVVAPRLSPPPSGQTCGSVVASQSCRRRPRAAGRGRCHVAEPPRCETTLRTSPAAALTPAPPRFGVSEAPAPPPSRPIASPSLGALLRSEPRSWRMPSASCTCRAVLWCGSLCRHRPRPPTGTIGAALKASAGPCLSLLLTTC